MGISNMELWQKTIPLTIKLTRGNTPKTYTKVNKNNYKLKESVIGCSTCEHRINHRLAAPCRECKYSGNVIDQDGAIS